MTRPRYGQSERARHAGYNSYAYAAGNPVTFTDPSGHVINPGTLTDVAGTVGLLKDTILGLVDVFQLATTLPPGTREFVTAPALFGLAIMRTILVLYLLSVGAIRMPAPVGTGGSVEVLSVPAT